MIPHRRRGACPSLAAPMQTGDGFLARLTLSGQTIPLDAATALCDASRRHGNGVIEVTSRGSLQVRGLTPQSIPAFVKAVGDIDIEVQHGVPIAVSPLAGLAIDEAIDAGGLAAALRTNIEAAGLNGRLAPKVAVAIDDGSALHLDALSADLRLRAESIRGVSCIHVAMGGTAESAVPIGAVDPGHAIEAAVRLLGELAARGEQARAREVIRLVGTGPFRAAIAHCLMAGALAPANESALPSPPRRPRAQAIGPHTLRDGTVALGIGLPFGHADSGGLLALIAAAQSHGAAGLRACPDRALLIVGVPTDRSEALADAIVPLGFITTADDPRRAMAACPGAPFCACTEVPMRALAPEVALAAPALFDGSLMMHFSGCAKGCAFQGRAGLTVVGGDGRCAVVINGRPQDLPVAAVSPQALTASLARLASVCTRERRPGEAMATVLSRFGAAEIAAILVGAAP